MLYEHSFRDEIRKTILVTDHVKLSEVISDRLLSSLPHTLSDVGLSVGEDLTHVAHFLKQLAQCS